MARVYFSKPDPLPAALKNMRPFAPLSHAEVDHDHRMSVDEFLSPVALGAESPTCPRRSGARCWRGSATLVGDRGPLILRYRTEIYWTRLT